MMNEIYNMGLHEEYHLQIASKTELKILRVPGGWIYTQFYDTGYENLDRWQTASTFVPFDNDMQQRQEDIRQQGKL